MKSFPNQKSFLFLLVFIIWVCIQGCDNKFEKNPKYNRPDWLVGKIYSQIDANDDLSLFAKCISDVGYDSIINKTGAYAAFIPNNDAVNAYLNEKGYASIDDMPFEEKSRLVRFHLVQMPWTAGQLQSLSRRGWIDENDVTNNKPFAFKRQTLLRNSNKTYNIETIREGLVITETIVPQSNETKTVFANSRKYAPIFYDAYWNVAKLNPNDYSFYFDREFEIGEIYFAGSKIISEEIFSDNGFIYIVDKVVEPLMNAEELMEKGSGSYSYDEFKNLIYQNSEFIFNSDATYSQEGASQGFEVEELFDLSFSGIDFDIHQELTFDPSSGAAQNNTMENHYGIIVPTDDAIQKFEDEVLSKAMNINSIKDLPANLKRMLINSHISSEPIYLSNINNGFFNHENDFVELDQSTIIQKEFGSNATFIGVNELIIPKALTSVTAPLYLNSDYLTYLMTLQTSLILDALKADDVEFSLFIMPERVFVHDLSLMLEWTSWRRDTYVLRAYNRSEEKWDIPNRATVSNLVFNQIGIEPVIGKARKEFIETITQRHIVLDNSNKTITGGVPSSFGYMGDSIITVSVEPLAADYYNGKVYEIDGWLSFPTQTLLTRLAGRYFLELLKKAGLATDFQLRFVNSTDRYTLFLPTNEALQAAQADTLTGDNLKQFLLGHIIKDELIFTDGRRNEGAYNTLKKSISGTGLSTLNIQPNFDEILIFDSNWQNNILTIIEQPGKTNILAVKTHNGKTITHAVIHEIDTVINIDN